MIVVERAIANKAEICRLVIDDLTVPWPGLNRNKEDAIAMLMDLPIFIANFNGRNVGFCALQQMTANSFSVVFIGVLRAFQRQGAGSALLRKAEEFCRHQKAFYLTAKTVAESDNDRDYGQPRHFFSRAAFSGVEIFPQIWGRELPCLYMIKTIEQESEQGEYTWY